ncbi:MAG TPA: PAS domain-containing protein [Longimicrobiales bacterium]|nr:PAS domain-containing protein [Longimicrobiales bacterium]
MTRPPGSVAPAGSPYVERVEAAPEKAGTAATPVADPAQASGAVILRELVSAIFPSGSGGPPLAWKERLVPPLPLARGGEQSVDDALRSAELRYRTLVEQIPAVTFMAALGEKENELYVSPYIETLLGYTQHEWLQDPLLWYSRIHPHDRQLWVREFARGCRTGGPFRVECRLLARCGRVVWVRAEVRIVGDEHGRPLFLQGVAFDVTDSKRAERRVLRQAVRRTEEHYRDLIHGLEAVVWEAEVPSGRFVFVSHGAERILGFPAKRWLREPGFWIERVHPEDRDDVVVQWRHALATGTDRSFEFRAVTAAGDVVWLQNNVHAPTAASGRALAFGIIVDTTERKRIEERLAQLLASEQAAREEAEASREGAEHANRLKDEFLATLSHELRTPMNAVIGWSSVLELDQIDEDLRRRAIAAIKRNAHSQAEVVEDLLDISRIVTGKLHLEIERIDFAAVVDTAIESIKLAADAKHIGIATHAQRRPAWVLGAADRLQQVVLNLLSNAVKFTPRHGHVNVHLEAEDDTVRVSVADTGQGIDPAFLPHVFDRFRQADGTYTRVHGGLGLGLAIARHLTELHGGKVRAESPGPGLGATFTVELPAAPAPEASEPRPELPRPAARACGAERALAGARVLVADDHRDSLEVLVRVLTRAGADVVAVSNGEQALELLDRRHFDLLVCDVGMPEMDGIQVIGRIRSSRGPNRCTPAAALTAYASERDRRRALDAGFDAHIAKPLSAEEIVSELGMLLSARAR